MNVILYVLILVWSASATVKWVDTTTPTAKPKATPTQPTRSKKVVPKKRRPKKKAQANPTPTAVPTEGGEGSAQEEADEVDYPLPQLCRGTVTSYIKRSSKSKLSRGTRRHPFKTLDQALTALKNQNPCQVILRIGDKQFDMGQFQPLSHFTLEGDLGRTKTQLTGRIQNPNPYFVTFRNVSIDSSETLLEQEGGSILLQNSTVRLGGEGQPPLLICRGCSRFEIDSSHIETQGQALIELSGLRAELKIRKSQWTWSDIRIDPRRELGLVELFFRLSKDVDVQLFGRHNGVW